VISSLGNALPKIMLDAANPDCHPPGTMDADVPKAADVQSQAKNDVIFPTLANNGGSCTFGEIMEVAKQTDRAVAFVLPAVLTQLKVMKKVAFSDESIVRISADNPHHLGIIVTAAGESEPNAAAMAPPQVHSPINVAVRSLAARMVTEIKSAYRLALTAAPVRADPNDAREFGRGLASIERVATAAAAEYSDSSRVVAVTADPSCSSSSGPSSPAAPHERWPARRLLVGTTKALMDVTFLLETALTDADFAPWEQAAAPTGELRRLLRLACTDWPNSFLLLSGAGGAFTNPNAIKSATVGFDRVSGTSASGSENEAQLDSPADASAMMPTEAPAEVPFEAHVDVSAEALGCALGEELAELTLFRLGSLCYAVVAANRGRRLAHGSDWPCAWGLHEEIAWMQEGTHALQRLFRVRSPPPHGWAGDRQATRLCELGFFSDAHVIASMHLAHLLCWQGQLDEARTRVETFINAITHGPLRSAGWDSCAAEQLLAEIAMADSRNPIL